MDEGHLYFATRARKRGALFLSPESFHNNNLVLEFFPCYCQIFDELLRYLLGVVLFPQGCSGCASGGWSWLRLTDNSRFPFCFFFEKVFRSKVIWGSLTETLAQRIARESAEKVVMSLVPTFCGRQNNIHPLSLEFPNTA